MKGSNVKTKGGCNVVCVLFSFSFSWLDGSRRFIRLAVTGEFSQHASTSISGLFILFLHYTKSCKT